jgi:hypothetical protein
VDLSTLESLRRDSRALESLQAGDVSLSWIGTVMGKRASRAGSFVALDPTCDEIIPPAAGPLRGAGISR